MNEATSTEVAVKRSAVCARIAGNRSAVPFDAGTAIAVFPLRERRG
jgi:hypothetical protein